MATNDQIEKAMEKIACVMCARRNHCEFNDEYELAPHGGCALRGSVVRTELIKMGIFG